MKSKHLILSAVVALAGFLPQSKASLNLGSADSFAVLAGSTVTVTGTGATVLYGDLGVFPGTSITGAPIVNGMTYSGGSSIAEQAQSDALAAYTSLATEGNTGDLSVTGLSEKTLTPGVWKFTDGALLDGKLTLNALGDSNARFDFQITGALTTGSGSSVLLENGAQWANVFWQVGSSATLGPGTSFNGSILADQSIALGTGANMFGRALALNAAVTLDNNNITAVPEPNAYLAGFCTIAVFLFGWRNRK